MSILKAAPNVRFAAATRPTPVIVTSRLPDRRGENASAPSESGCNLCVTMRGIDVPVLGVD